MILDSSIKVRICSAPPYMGHEEIVLPMLVVSSDASSPHLSRFEHFMNPGFQPNDLANTLVAGLLAGSGRGGERVSVETMFTAYSEMVWRTPLIAEALQALGRRYAFFLQESPSPLYDGYIARCRFLAPDALRNYYTDLDIEAETCQPLSAEEVIQIFFAAYDSLPNWNDIYRQHLDAPVFREMFGDEEQHAVGYAVWLERPEVKGPSFSLKHSDPFHSSAIVLRAWTRVIYLPK